MSIALLNTEPLPADAENRAARDEIPRPWAMTLATALDATVITPASTRRGHMFLRGMWAAIEGFRRRRDYELIIADCEAAGFSLAGLFRITRQKSGLIMYGEGRATHTRPRWCVKLSGMRGRIDRVVCVGKVNAQRYVTELGFDADRVALVPRPADHLFWRPVDIPPSNFICSAIGREYQDYPTLLRALEGSDTDLRVAGTDSALPPNVQARNYTPSELRRLYAESAFVVVPVRGDRGGQAGSRVVFEAMAMGKAVIATRTRGLVGLGMLREGETCLLVDPGDVDGWRSAIERLRSNPAEAEAMGRRARQLVEQEFNLDIHVGRVSEIVRELLESAGR